MQGDNPPKISNNKWKKKKKQINANSKNGNFWRKNVESKKKKGNSRIKNVISRKNVHSEMKGVNSRRMESDKR